MNKKITIAIDAMGGENSPIKTIQGISLFVKRHAQKDYLLINRTYVWKRDIHNILKTQ